MHASSKSKMEFSRRGTKTRGALQQVRQKQTAAKNFCLLTVLAGEAR